MHWCCDSSNTHNEGSHANFCDSRQKIGYHKQLQKDDHIDYATPYVYLSWKRGEDRSSTSETIGLHSPRVMLKKKMKESNISKT